MHKLKLGILISGRGSNMQALIEACRADPDFPAAPAMVISDNADAGGLAIARAAGVPVAVHARKDYADKHSFERAIDADLHRHGVTLVCLAGFMRILSADFVQGWAGRIINIHPSLLPAYRGLDTHARVIAAGEGFTGCTVHHVTPELDAGPTILQRKVRVMPGDTAETLAARVLAEEHIAYPKAVQRLAGQQVPTNQLNFSSKSSVLATQTTADGNRDMADHSHQIETDPEQIAQAQALWGNFVFLSKIGIGLIILSLVFMALFLL